MVDLDELERLANAATPGEWEQCGKKSVGCQCGLIWSKLAEGIVAKAMSAENAPDEEKEGFTAEQAKKNAAFIAALNPQTALLLISEARKVAGLEAELAEYKAGAVRITRMVEESLQGGDQRQKDGE